MNNVLIVTKDHLRAIRYIQINHILLSTIDNEYLGEILELFTFGYIGLNNGKYVLTDKMPPTSDNQSNMYCEACRSMGLIHCSEVEYCTGMKPMFGVFENG
ncbi:MAG: hypothetical protein WC679_02700 [Bacteroidales bacterium]|jgi:hypothetical protein